MDIYKDFYTRAVKYYKRGKEDFFHYKFHTQYKLVGIGQNEIIFNSKFPFKNQLRLLKSNDRLFVYLCKDYNKIKSNKLEYYNSEDFKVVFFENIIKRLPKEYKNIELLNKNIYKHSYLKNKENYENYTFYFKFELNMELDKLLFISQFLKQSKDKYILCFEDVSWIYDNLKSHKDFVFQLGYNHEKYTDFILNLFELINCNQLGNNRLDDTLKDLILLNYKI